MKKVFLIKREGCAESDEFIEEIHQKFSITKNPKTAETIFVLGGDGTMLNAIDKYKDLDIPFFGFNYGHIGFLMNEPVSLSLQEISENKTNIAKLNILVASCYDASGKLIASPSAFNDFNMERASSQTAKIQVKVNGVTRFNSLVCDGIILSSPAGSTAYNASAGGIILPFQSNALVLTGISPALYHRWRSTVLTSDSVVTFTSLDTQYRPVRFMADGVEVPNTHKAKIKLSNKQINLGFASSCDFGEKVMRLQFSMH